MERLLINKTAFITKGGLWIKNGLLQPYRFRVFESFNMKKYIYLLRLLRGGK